MAGKDKITVTSLGKQIALSRRPIWTRVGYESYGINLSKYVRGHSSTFNRLRYFLIYNKWLDAIELRLCTQDWVKANEILFHYKPYLELNFCEYKDNPIVILRRKSLVEFANTLGLDYDFLLNEVLTEDNVIFYSPFRWIFPLSRESKETALAMITFDIPIEPIRIVRYHYAIYGPTGYGKTTLVLNYLLPKIKERKAKVIIYDVHHEYPSNLLDEPLRIALKFETLVAPDVMQSEQYKLLIAMQFKEKFTKAVSDLSKTLLESMETDRDIVIRPLITNRTLEDALLDVVLKTLMDARFKKDRYFIIEEAWRFNVEPIVLYGRHSNLFGVFVSSKLLPASVNTMLIPIIGGKYPPEELSKSGFSESRIKALNLTNRLFAWKNLDKQSWSLFRLDEIKIDPMKVKVEEKYDLTVSL